jgi:dihydrodipicolinate synthase/N-acetylneuraminate lyase
VTADVTARVNFDGVSVALATPWRAAGGVDDAALERLVAHVCAAGVVAVCPAGTTGEGPRLSRDERVALVRRVGELTPPHVGIVGGVSSASLGETLDELAAQADAGAGAVLVTPPTRMPLGADGCRRFYELVAERTPVPIVVYHIPLLTGVPVPPDVVLDLAAHPNVLGLKDSAADIQYHLRVADGLAAAGHTGFALLTGTDATMVASMQAGGTGAILASANVVPALSVAVHRAVRCGDVAGALALLPRLRAIVIACRRGSLPAGWKAALELIGIGTRLAIPPGETLDDAQVASLRCDLERLGVLT